MARISNAIRDKQNNDAAHAKGERSLKQNLGEFVEVPFQWWTRQTTDSVFLPSYGWVSKSLIRWRKPTGQVVHFEAGRESDAFLIAQSALI